MKDQPLEMRALHCKAGRNRLELFGQFHCPCLSLLHAPCPINFVAPTVS
jgi:hypothetical protein